MKGLKDAASQKRINEAKVGGIHNWRGLARIYSDAPLVNHRADSMRLEANPMAASSFSPENFRKCSDPSQLFTGKKLTRDKFVLSVL